MSRLGFVTALGLLAAAGAAQAADDPISNLDLNAGTVVTYPFKIAPFGQTGAPDAMGNPGAFGTSSFSFFGTNFGSANFKSYATGNDGEPIFFESLDVVSGRNVGTVSHTQVSFDFANPYEVTPFESLITAAGLGFYLADLDGCALATCPQVVGANLTDIKRYNSLGPAGLVGFDFAIYDNGEERFRVSGLSTIGPNGPVDLFGTGTYLNGTGARGALSGFRSADGSDGGASHGFLWDETPVGFDLFGTGNHTITYSSTTFALTNAKTLGCGASLVAYSGFGDPIGRGGGVEAIESESFEAFGLSSFSDTGGGGGRLTGTCEIATGDDAIRGITSTPTIFQAPVFADGALVFDKDGEAVPEPATWAMMILGFGGIGAVMRRRRLAGATA